MGCRRQHNRGPAFGQHRGVQSRQQCLDRAKHMTVHCLPCSDESALAIMKSHELCWQRCETELFAGGSTTGAQPLASIEVYDPASNA